MVNITTYGSYQQYCPLGFPGYKRFKNRDIWRRRLFLENEANTRLHKYLHAQLGVSGPLMMNQKAGGKLVHGRCIRTHDTEGLCKWIRMGAMGLRQTANEGWLEKYGYKASARR